MEKFEPTIEAVDGGALKNEKEEISLQDENGFDVDETFESVLSGGNGSKSTKIDTENSANFHAISDSVFFLRFKARDEKVYGRKRTLQEICSDPNISYFDRSRLSASRNVLNSLSFLEKKSILEAVWIRVKDNPRLASVRDKSINDLDEAETLLAFSVFQSMAPSSVISALRHQVLQRRFNDESLIQRYGVLKVKYFEKYEESRKKIISDETMYSRVSTHYGAIYDPSEGIDCFFSLDSSAQPEKLDFQEVLRREGFSRESVGDEEFKKLNSAYQAFMSPALRKKIEDDFLVRFEFLPIRSQVQFLNFLSKKNSSYVDKVRGFLGSKVKFPRISPFISQSDSEELQKKNISGRPSVERINRLKSFLSLEQGGAEMGEKILAIGEQLPKEAADRVFAKYVEMAERASEVRKNSEKDADAIEVKLLERGKSLLSWIAKHAEEFSRDEKLLLALNERLESLNAETILAVNALRAAKESGNAEGIQEFLDGSFRILKGGDLSAKTIAEMESLYRMSYPSDLEEQFREKLVKDLHEKKISDPSARFYTFFMREQEKESLKAFCSFQDRPDGSVYFGAFNVDEFFSGEKMGCLMMDESLEREAKGHIVRAACIPEKPISEHYIEKRGFVGKSFSDLEGIDLLAIERDDKNVGHYETKRMTQEDVIRKSEAGFKDASQIFLSVPEASLSRESIEVNVKDGCALTRMFRRGEGESAKVYLAFEK